MELEQLWQTVLGEMETQLSKANFITWLKNSFLAEEKEDGVFVISLPNSFAKVWVEDKYQKDILGIIRRFNSSVKKLEFVVSNQIPKQVLKKGSAPVVEEVPQINTINLDFKVDPETNLNTRYSLNSFITGPSNELAYAGANAIVQEVGTKYNPFIIYGGVGLGKTHLIQAIGNEIKTKYKGKIKTRYVPSEKYTSDVVWAIRNNRMEDIKKKYRDVDVLIIDDVQFIGGKEKTEEEFFNTFNALYENNKQIIISCDRPPQSIPILHERLRSRFEGGLITDISYPEYELRVAIIKDRLQELNLELDAEIVDMVANGAKRNIRELEGILNKIFFYQEAKRIIDRKSVEEIIEKATQNFSKKVSDAQIIKAVAEFFRVDIDDLTGHVRKKEFVEPRQIVMYLLRDILDVSYPYIGEKMRKDHTTAIHAFKKINHEINKNSSLNQKILSIKDLIYKDA